MLTTWITPSLAMPSVMVAVVKPLILMLMIGPKRKMSIPNTLPSSRVWRSICVAESKLARFEQISVHTDMEKSLGYACFAKTFGVIVGIGV